MARSTPYSDTARAVNAALPVTIYSDVICPWCYVGKRRFETALATPAPGMPQQLAICCIDFGERVIFEVTIVIALKIMKGGANTSYRS